MDEKKRGRKSINGVGSRVIAVRLNEVEVSFIREFGRSVGAENFTESVRSMINFVRALNEKQEEHQLNIS